MYFDTIRKYVTKVTICNVSIRYRAVAGDIKFNHIKKDKLSYHDMCKLVWYVKIGVTSLVA